MTATSEANRCPRCNCVVDYACDCPDWKTRFPLVPEPKVQTAPTIRYDIFIAGDLAQAKKTCRGYCMAVGLCVTVEPVAYIYTGGEEAGVRVGLINYPRFPATNDDLKATALKLAHTLMFDLCQHSFSIVGPDETIWVSRRPS